MPITALPTPPSRMNPTQFSAQTDAFLASLPQFTNEANALAVNLNSIAAGGAYALPYRLSYSTNNYARPAGGWTYWNGAGKFGIDVKTSDGVDVLAALLALLSSNSAVKAQMRIVNMRAPSSFTLIDIVGYSYSAGSLYVNLDYVIRASAGSINEGDEILLQITRTGDKGDKGDNGTSVVPVLWAREEQPSGTSRANTTSGYSVRFINTTYRNTMGATVASNRFTVPAGTYRFHASAPANGVGSHQIRIWNATLSNVMVYGTSEQSSGSASSRSIVEGDVTLDRTTTFELQHWCSTASGSLGQAASNPASNEVFAEIYFEKIA